MSIDPFEAIKVTFFQECEELLGDLESGLLALESGDSDLETINAVFRAVHSVKGGAGAFGMDALVRFAHVFETLMDELRAGRKPCDDITVKTLLRASDVLADHVAAAKGEAPDVDEGRSAGLVVEMEALTRGEVPAVAAVAAVAPAPVVVEEDDFGFKPLAFDLDTYRLLLNHLSRLGAGAPDLIRDAAYAGMDGDMTAALRARTENDIERCAVAALRRSA